MTDDQLTAIARKSCALLDIDPDALSPVGSMTYLDASKEQLRHTLKAIEASDFAVVPVELSTEMEIAGINQINKVLGINNIIPTEVDYIFKAIVAARPKAGE